MSITYRTKSLDGLVSVRGYTSTITETTKKRQANSDLLNGYLRVWNNKITFDNFLAKLLSLELMQYAY